MNRKNFGIAAIALGLMLLIPPSADAQAGPCTLFFPQGTWNITAHGHQGTLFVTVDTSGIIGGTMTLPGDGGVDTIRGFFDARACKLTFLRIDGPSATAGNPSTIQAYTGYVYPALASNPSGQQRLAGSFEMFSPAAGGTAPRSVFGWHAFR
jgi:hypothetical protein